MGRCRGRCPRVAMTWRRFRSCVRSCYEGCRAGARPKPGMCCAVPCRCRHQIGGSKGVPHVAVRRLWSTVRIGVDMAGPCVLGVHLGLITHAAAYHPIDVCTERVLSTYLSEQSRFPRQVHFINVFAPFLFTLSLSPFRLSRPDRCTMSMIADRVNCRGFCDCSRSALERGGDRFLTTIIGTIGQGWVT
jgi:hypothetical protein